MKTAEKRVPEISLFGCCSYQDTWKPGIEGWGETDEDSRSNGYVSVQDYDALAQSHDELLKALKALATWMSQSEAGKSIIAASHATTKHGWETILLASAENVLKSAETTL